MCFPQFKVSVAYSAEAKKCVLKVTPDVMANNLKYGEANSTNGAKVGSDACMRGGRQRLASGRDGWEGPCCVV